MTLRLLLFIIPACFGTLLHAQWRPSGLDGRSMVCFASSGANLFAGHLNSGSVFRSTDRGASWTLANVGLPNVEIWSLAFHNADLFAGTGIGVYRSSDSGGSWVPATTGLPTMPVKAIAVCGSYLVAGTYGAGMFRSSDNGASWTKVTAGLAGRSFFALVVQGEDIVAGSADGAGVFRSRDSGATWAAVGSGLPDVNIFALAISGGDIVAGTQLHGLYRLDNGAASWAKVAAGPATATVYALVIDGANLLAGGDHGVLRSSDNGATWTQYDDGMTAPYVFALAVDGTDLFAGVESNGVWRRSSSQLGVVEAAGGSDGAAAMGLSVVPNPATRTALVRYTLASPATVGLSVFDALGHAVLEQPDVREEAGAHDATIDAGMLRDGMYVLRLRVGTRSLWGRMMVAH